MRGKKVQMKRKSRRQRRNENAILFGSIILCIVTLCAITVCLVMIFRYRAAQIEVTEMQDEIARLQENYTPEEVEAMLESEKENAALLASEETEDAMLGRMKELMLSGEGAVNMLRKFFPDEIVLVDNTQYYFFPISDTLKKHPYLPENFIYTEDELIEYYENGELVSHKGIDVSGYQGKINWPKVAAEGVEYAFIRLGIRGYTEGAIKRDDSFEDNINGALDNGIEAGVYFFTQAASVEEAEEEAQYVLNEIEPYDITYPVVLDVEAVNSENARTAELTKEERTEYCIAFCEMIKQAGYTPMIYGNLKTFMLLLDMEQLEDYDKWFAYYDTELYFPYNVRVWQYTDTGSIEGIGTDVDIDISFGEFSGE
ncbi:MAG: hypothetical protein NC341_06870 [Blautia sp.]|nr:hypothetical protein [Blautia sp.]MCM1201209.1 hypothetical protein [Bacteroides fragilis]